MIPALIEIEGAPWSVLPPGIHWAELPEIEIAFAATAPRRTLFDGFVQVVFNLAHAGCRRLYLDGSFVTGKPEPEDFDGCWEAEGVNMSLVDPVLLSFENNRALQKQRYRGEMFIARASADGTKPFLDFFQIEKYTGAAKGIIGIDLP